MQRRSLVLVTVDCLRADRIGSRRSVLALTPFLDGLSNESISFSHALVAGAPTYFSFPGIMASRHPLGLGREITGVAPGEPTIATTLHDAGYDTAAFIAGNPYLSARFGYREGFDQFSDFLEPGPTPDAIFTAEANSRWSQLNRRIERWSSCSRISAATYNELYFHYCQWRSWGEGWSLDRLRRYPAANVLVDEACAWLKQRTNRPFFLWIHLMDPHHPYYPPPEALQSLGISNITPKRARFLNSFWNRADVSVRRLQHYREEVMGLYDAGVHWVDRQLSHLVDVLKEQHRWTETIFAVTADHGEQFLEGGNRYHPPTSLREQLIRVPLLIHADGLSASNVNGPFSLIHLSPTLLQGLGVESPSTFNGRGLWNEISSGKLPDLPAIVECIESCNNQLSMSEPLGSRLMAVVQGKYKLVLRFRENNDRFYDLESDPDEVSPLPDTVQTKDRAQLLECAREHLRKAAERRDPELALRARLRSIRQRMAAKSTSSGTLRKEYAVEIGEHG